MPLPTGRPLLFKPQPRPLWTENKAKLIERYLYYFVLVTKHGAYIDGFAAPQDRSNPDSWACKLVLASKPQFLREFWLCDIDANGCDALRKMAAEISCPKNRRVEIVEGDFNVTVRDVLARCHITERTAAFCLLDQRTFECKWDTVRTLAEFKREGHKIELFYFLASGWLDRALAGTKATKQLIDWWGAESWRVLRGMNGRNRADFVARRFHEELGYAYTFPWAIYDRGNNGRIMYHMIHATDHPGAPLLMNRAYYSATKARESLTELQAELHALWGGSPIAPRPARSPSSR